MNRCLIGVLLCFFANSPLTARANEEKTEVLCTSPSGAFRVEFAPAPSAAGEDATGDVWVVSTKNPAQRVKLPKEAADSPTDDEIHFSPNEEWIFGLRHVGSGLRYGNIYHLVSPEKIELATGDKSFNDVAWEHAVKLGAVKRNYSADGVYAMTFFRCWSLDSSRLLIELAGGEEKRSMKSGFLYFNTRIQQFELTDYLRKLNSKKSGTMACAEPVDPLPSEPELKANLEKLDARLNTRYAEVIAKTEKDQVPNVREAQRNWIKHRDEGAQFYAGLFPAAEKEQRRLQFLCDVTAARISTPAEQWEL